MKILRISALLISLGLAGGLRAATTDESSDRIRVKVVDASGKALSGADVERYLCGALPFGNDLSTRLEERRTTDADGVATFASPGKNLVTFVARKPGLSLGWTIFIPLRQLKNDSMRVITLTPPASVSGLVQDASGKPVDGAAVWVNGGVFSKSGADEETGMNILLPTLSGQLLTTRTTADGKFRIDGLPEGATLELGATKPGLAMDQAALAFGPGGLSHSAGESNLVLTLNPAGTIAGRVVQEGSGAPLAGVTVSLVNREGLSGYTSTNPVTGVDGTFRLPDLAAGEHTLHAGFGTNNFPEWVFEQSKISVEAGTTNEVKVVATRGGVLEVFVKDESTGTPVKDTQIIVFHESTGIAGVTSDKGIASMRLAPGDYSVSVESDGSFNQQTRATVESGQTNRVEIALGSGSKVSGVVLDAAGKPASKVSVFFFPYYNVSRETDEAGRFTVSANPNQFSGMNNLPRILIASDSSRNLAAILDLDEDVTTNVTLRLEPGMTMAGRVTDPSGKPVTNASVNLMFHTERFGSSLGRPTHTDASGNYAIKGLPPGRRYGISVSAKGFGSANTTMNEPSETRLVETNLFQLPVADKRIAGVVVDEDNNPVVAHVNGYGDNQANVNGRTDSKGRFTFNNVCAGPIQLNANPVAGGSSGSVSAEGGDTNIVIQLGVRQSPGSRGNSKVQGTVVDPDGKPVPQIAVSLFPDSDSGKKTDANGNFTLRWDPNRYGGMQLNQRVVVVRDAQRNLAAAVDVEDGATNVTVRLVPGVSLAGRVTDVNGKPLTNAEASLMVWTEQMGSSANITARANAEGRFEIKALPLDRRYGVTVSAKGFGQDSHDVTPTGSDRQVELPPFQLLVADQKIAGVVVDADDKPVARAWINCYGDKQPSLNAQTDAKGQFSFDKVCNGKIRISASSQNGYGSTTADSGDTNITLRLRTSSSGSRMVEARVVSLKGNPLPDVAPLGLSAADVPTNKPVLAVLIDAEQRPSRRMLRVVTEKAETLKQLGVAVIVVQAGSMQEGAFKTWKTENNLPFPVGCLKDDAKARAAWGVAALPRLILTDKNHRVVAEGFPVDELDSRAQAIAK